MGARVSIGQRAVVIGASIAGLAVARVLADHFEEVVILERDAIDAGSAPAPRRSVPQGRHIHALLASGYRAAAALYPDFAARLASAGATHYRVGVDTAYHFADGHAYTLFGRWRTPCDTGIDVYSQSRALVEHVVRQCTLSLPNVRMLSGAQALGLVAPDGSVRGVRYSEREGDAAGRPAAAPRTLEADLVVDAAGRRSLALRWLAELGHAAPAESSIGVKFAYASARFRLPRALQDGARSVLVVSPDLPAGGIAQEIEDRTWIVSLGARGGIVPPTDATGFRDFACALHSPRIAQLLDGAEQLEQVASFRYPASTWRHYEGLRSFPAGLLAVGDALCSFNPVWGQGMSVALLQAVELGALLARYRAAAIDGSWRGRLAPDFFRKAARVIGTPWSIAADLDLSHPQTEGVRPRGMALRVRYSAALDALAHDDPQLTRLLYEVYHLIEPASSLASPRLAGRALWQIGRDALARGRERHRARGENMRREHGARPCHR